MTDFLILLSLFPFIFLAFGNTRKLRIITSSFSILIAAFSVGYLVFVHLGDPFLWISMGTFLSLFAVGVIDRKEVRGLTVLGVLFISQALLCAETSHIIILLAFADAFFGVELFLSSKLEDKNKAVQSVYLSAWTFLPAAAAVLLQLRGDWVTVFVAATIVMRLFSWPVNHWVLEINKGNRQFMIFLGGISAFALWHAQDLGVTVPWAAIWLVVAVLFSVGAKSLEIYGALVLGLFSLSPVLGILAMALWSLFAHQGKLVFLIALFVAAAGTVISNAAGKFLIEQLSFPLAAIAGIALARVFVGAAMAKVKWYWELVDFLVATAWVGVLFWFSPPEIKFAVGPGLAFGIGFILVFAFGKILQPKRPTWFLPARSLSLRVFSKGFISSDFLSEKTGAPIRTPQTRLREVFFLILESESHLVFLLGLLGAILLWGVR